MPMKGTMKENDDGANFRVEVQQEKVYSAITYYYMK
jgi:hypothetical protein